MANTILQEIKQKRPFQSLHQQVVVNLLRTSRVIEESWVVFIKKVEGISLSQFNVLRILRGARPEKLKVSEISDRMITRDPDITRLVDRLVKQGLAERERDTADRRVVFVTISEAGLELLARLDDAVTAQSAAVLAGLSTTQLRELDTMLDQLREGMKPFP